MAISPYLVLPLLAFAALVQSTAMPHLAVFGVAPDLVLLLTVSWVLLYGSQESVLAGLAGGVMTDVLSGAPFGLATLALTVVSYLVGLSEVNVFRTARFLPYLAISVATLLYHLIWMFLLQAAGRVVPWWPNLWRLVLPATVLNVLCMPLVHGAVRWLKSHTQPKPVEWQ